MVATARALFGNPLPQYLNALNIATNQAITNTGITSIFIMEGANVDSKWIVLSPLTINLTDGKKVRSTHVCDITIPGLPTVLTGHIIPSVTIASLIGIYLLCKVGCKVIFDNEKCEVVYNNHVILTGYKDSSIDLWTLHIPKGRLWTSPSLATMPPLPRPGPCIGCAPRPLPVESNVHPGINIATSSHSVQMRANTVKFAHQSLRNPKISTLLKAT
jgi:hypothetical protein